MATISAVSRRTSRNLRITFIIQSILGCLVFVILLAVRPVHLLKGSSLLVFLPPTDTGTTILKSSQIRGADNKNSLTFFDRAAQDSLNITLQHTPTEPRTTFRLASWTQKTTGGLTDQDRTLLGRIYSEADSVFEWGLGESTYIASHVGVRRYAGIDSDAEWVANARDKSLPHFRFYLADIGKTGIWGYPEKELAKASLDYQVAPMLSEELPFDVYMVDGRYRLACMLIAFLHASARGGDPTKTKVLFHDCTEQKKLYQYRKADSFLNLVEESGSKLCVYMRKADTTDQQLYDLWKKEYINTL
ncbi:hypothetical protein FisN_15Hu016 [Fistulifera solaris]|uniref:Uncharacterized protein n=1 Tax=Fistulifera solaris TaxID=1519565 RepID=A0A1Z5KA90_FISSO|nr:hypothetical protein FisN_15Hu016 [Fistulifera solaris]|eukprot:GAX23082.1 hypothetical protein FisN_15Hu016 [Fistulifera solaris]